MVTMHAARWQLGTSFYRETGDVNLGIPPIVARDHRVASRLKDISYVQVAGNRFARGCRTSDFDRGTRAGSATAIRSLFGSRNGMAMAALAAQQRLSPEAADERYTRIRALVARVLGE